MTILVFFWSRTCGHSRRMDSLVDHFMRQHRGEVKLAKVEIADRPDLARRFNVDQAPTLLLLSDLTEQSRIVGRCTLPRIKSSFEPFLDLTPTELPQTLAVGAC